MECHHSCQSLISNHSQSTDNAYNVYRAIPKVIVGGLLTFQESFRSCIFGIQLSVKLFLLVKCKNIITGPDHKLLSRMYIRLKDRVKIWQPELQFGFCLLYKEASSYLIFMLRIFRISSKNTSFESKNYTCTCVPIFSSIEFNFSQEFIPLIICYSIITWQMP